MTLKRSYLHFSLIAGLLFLLSFSAISLSHRQSAQDNSPELSFSHFKQQTLASANTAQGAEDLTLLAEEETEDEKELADFTGELQDQEIFSILKSLGNSCSEEYRTPALQGITTPVYILIRVFRI